MATRITEIISRSTQGITRPFLCRCADDRLYYVKGNFAGRKALCAEWIGASLGRCFGLPIPPFAQIEIPGEFISYSARDDIADLGAGIAFGSEKIDCTDELRFPLADSIDKRLRAKILWFDWWVCNPDRTLTADGGNPNLLWFARDSKVIVIDHNLAFEEQEMDGFWDQHIFRDAVSEWNEVFINDMHQNAGASLLELSSIWRELPPEWTETAAGITLESVTTLLSRFEADASTFYREQ